MKAQIQISDSAYEAYQKAAEGMQGLGQALTPEEIMADRLTRFQDVSPSDRVIVIDPRARGRLETLLSGGSLHDAVDLVKKVEGLAAVSIGEIRLDFTPAEVRQIDRWAYRNGRTPEIILKEVVDRIKLSIFDYVPNA